MGQRSGEGRPEETKNGERREVLLSAAADAALARRWTPEASGYVFGSENWNTYRTAWEAAVRRAKITNLRFHDLRHTFASWLAQKGRPLKEIQEALGHQSLAMTMRYAHLAPDNLRAAVASLDGILPQAPSVSARAGDGARMTQENHPSRNHHQPIGDPAATSRV